MVRVMVVDDEALVRGSCPVGLRVILVPLTTST
jgi:hypothetical protein